MADLTREQIERVYSNFEKVIDCSPVHEGKAEARKCLRMVTDLALSALDAQGGEPVAWMCRENGKAISDAQKRELGNGITEHYNVPAYTAPPPPEAMLKELREARDDVEECLQRDLLCAGYARYDKRIKFRQEHLARIDALLSAKT